MGLRRFNINLSTFFSIKDRKISVEKAYTEGIYADTPANRKLGRVGMSYSEWEDKQNKPEEKKIDTISTYLLEKTLKKKEIYPLSVRDHGEYFLVSLEKDDFKDKKKVERTKNILENLGAKVYISDNTHYLKAYKKEEFVKANEEQEIFDIGNIKFDYVYRSLTYEDGTETNLTTKEAELLKMLVSNPNQFISRDDLLEKIWGESNSFNSRSMDVYVNRLRNKLAKDKDIKILTVHWKGLKLIIPNKENKKEEKQNTEKNKYFVNKYGIEVVNSEINQLAEKYNKSTNKEEKEKIKEEIKKLYPNESWNDGEREWIFDEDINEYLGFADKKEEKKKVETKINKEVLDKINKHFGFEDESAEWFADTPIALIMANDGEFSEIIDEFTDYIVLDQSGSYKNDGSRSNMLNCNIEYNIIPKFTPDEDVEINKKSFVVDHKTTIRDILGELGSYNK